jgi:hypothetical protein
LKPLLSQKIRVGFHKEALQKFKCKGNANPL